jgi:hypothetical protein
MRITFRTFKMYMYYGTDSQNGKGNLRILFHPSPFSVRKALACSGSNPGASDV